MDKGTMSKSAHPNCNVVLEGLLRGKHARIGVSVIGVRPLVRANTVKP